MTPRDSLLRKLELGWIQRDREGVNEPGVDRRKGNRPRRSDPGSLTSSTGRLSGGDAEESVCSEGVVGVGKGWPASGHAVGVSPENLPVQTGATPHPAQAHKPETGCPTAAGEAHQGVAPGSPFEPKAEASQPAKDSELVMRLAASALPAEGDHSRDQERNSESRAPCRPSRGVGTQQTSDGTCPTREKGQSPPERSRRLQFHLHAETIEKLGA